MKIGNEFVGLTTEKNYYAMYIFPIGLELCVFSIYWELSFIMGPLEVNLSIKKNNTMFNN